MSLPTLIKPPPKVPPPDAKIVYRIAPPLGDRTRKGTVVAVHDGREIGYISWLTLESVGINTHDIDRIYEIAMIRVLPEYRRRGIATALLREARKHAPIKNSIFRTRDGDIWARTNGLPVPTCYCHYCDRSRYYRMQRRRLRRMEQDARYVWEI